MSSNKKILMIVNEFPPTAESGVQRPLKFAKYLVRAGYKVYIITPKKPTKNVLDFELIKDIPKEAIVIKTHSFGLKGKSTDRIAFIRHKITNKQTKWKSILWNCMKSFNDIIFPIDKQIGWVPFALWEAIKIIRHYKIRKVYITAYPFSAFLVGILLKKVFKEKIFWVADYRDAWQFEPKFDKMVSHLRKKIVIYTEKQILNYADYFVFTTDYIYSQYIKNFPFIKNKSSVITNGYDEDDFQKIHPKIYPKFTFLFMGKIYLFKGSPIPLFLAMKRYKEKNSDLTFNLIHIGTVPQKILKFVKENRINFYSYEGYKNHKEALNFLSGANVLVIIVNNDDSSKCVLPGKLFEYLRIGKPILALGPKKSMLEKYIELTNSGVFASCEDEIEIENAIHSLISNIKKYKPKLKLISNYSRENLTKQLIKIYESNA